MDLGTSLMWSGHQPGQQQYLDQVFLILQQASLDTASWGCPRKRIRAYSVGQMLHQATVSHFPKISVARTNHVAKTCVKVVGALELHAKEDKCREDEVLGSLMQPIDHNKE